MTKIKPGGDFTDLCAAPPRPATRGELRDDCQPFPPPGSVTPPRRVTWLRGRAEKRKKKGGGLRWEGAQRRSGRAGAGGGRPSSAVTLTPRSTGLHTSARLGVDFLRAPGALPLPVYVSRASSSLASVRNACLSSCWLARPRWGLRAPSPSPPASVRFCWLHLAAPLPGGRRPAASRREVRRRPAGPAGGRSPSGGGAHDLG